MHNRSSPYEPHIDGLRAVAILPVLLFHFFPRVLPGGFIGVDIFFVISGFLISRILMVEFANKNFSYTHFYSRRIRRLFPALLICLATALVAGWFTFLTDEYARLGRHTLASLFFSQNIMLKNESNYFDLSAELKPLLHFWSLAVEEQFYLFWPALLGLFIRLRWNVRGLIVLGFFISFILNVSQIHSYPSNTFYEIQTRFWELLAGAHLADVTLNHGTLFKSKGAANLVSGLGFLFIATGFLVLNPYRLFPGWWALLPVTGSFLILAAGAQSTWNQRILSHPVMVFIGLISYPLYLWHWLIFSFVRILDPQIQFATVESEIILLSELLLSIVLASLTYLKLELPLRRWARTPLRQRHFVQGLLVAFLFVSLGAGAVTLSHGFPERTAAQGPAPVEIVQTNNPYLKECQKIKLNGVEWCSAIDENSPPEIVVVGDSHGGSFTQGLEPLARQLNMNLHFFGTGQTLGLLHVGTEFGGMYSINGYRRLDDAFDWIEKNKPKIVVLSSRGAYYYTGISFEEAGHFPVIADLTSSGTKKESNAKIFQNGLVRTLTFLRELHIRTIFVYDTPELGFNPVEVCRERPVALFGHHAPNPCGVEYDAVMQRQKSYRDAVRGILTEFPEVQVVDPFPTLCDEHFCYALKDNMLYYSDSQHLSRAMAIHVASALKAFLIKLATRH